MNMSIKVLFKNLQNPLLNMMDFSVVVLGAVWRTDHSKLLECMVNINSEKCISFLQRGHLLIFSENYFGKAVTFLFSIAKILKNYR